MHYALALVDGAKITGIKDLSQEEFRQYRRHITDLEKFSLDGQMLSLVELNHASLVSAIAHAVEEYRQQARSSFDFFSPLFLNLNRLILNFLSSVRTYLDHTETRLKRAYGHDSKEFLAYKSLTAQAYDGYFSYRFLYKLRNYAQHCGLPAGAFSLSSTSVRPGVTEEVLRLMLVRDELLQKFDSWGKEVKADIQRQDPQFDIIPLLREKYEILREIDFQISEFAQEAHFQAGIELFDLLGEVKDRQGLPCIIEFDLIATERLNLSIAWFPFEAICRVTGEKISMNKIIV